MEIGSGWVDAVLVVVLSLFLVFVFQVATKFGCWEG